MGLILIICFLIITIVISITLAMLFFELVKKGGLASTDPVHFVCLIQCIHAAVIVVGLMIV